MPEPMKHCMTAIFLVLAASPVGAQSVANDPGVPGLNDYGWGFPVVTSQDANFYSVTLPLDVNRSVTDPDLRDAGVFNADGEPVPRIFLPAVDEVEQVERTRALPFVPLFSDIDVGEEDIRLLFERRGDYARVELDTGAAGERPAGRKLQSYIADTRELDQAIVAIELFWTQIDDGFVGRVTIEGSNDLGHWYMLASAAIADVRAAATSIVQRRVDVPGNSYDFLRMTWTDLPDNWTLAEINAVYTLGVAKSVRKSISVDTAGIDAEDGGRIFSLGGAAMIDQVRLVLPDANTILSASIFLWSETQQRWYRVLQGSWHHIGRGEQRIESSAEKIPRTRTSRIKVVVSAGQPGAAMGLEVGWLPDTLLFLAQGPGPYILATGRAADREAAFPQQRFYGVGSITALASENRQSVSATLGQRYALGGTDRLRIVKTFDWRTLALWLGLALGVGFVGFMATKIMRESSR